MISELHTKLDSQDRPHTRSLSSLMIKNGFANSPACPDWDDKINILHINIAIIHKYRADTSWELLDTWNIIRVSVWSLCAAVCAACYLWYLQSFLDNNWGHHRVTWTCMRLQHQDTVIPAGGLNVWTKLHVLTFNMIITTQFLMWSRGKLLNQC